MGQQELSPGLAHTHTHSPCTPWAPRAAAAAPSPWQLPLGCAWDPPFWPHISCQVFSNKCSRAMQGGAGAPLALSSLSIPPGTAVPCPLRQPRPLALCQRGKGCSLTKDGARGVPGGIICPPATKRSWGRAKCQLPQRGDTLDPEGWQQGDHWGCRGSFQGGITGCFGDLQPSPGSGVSCVCHLVPHVPTSSRHVPPSPWVPRAAHPSQGPRPLSPPCAVPCHAPPRCLGGHLSHIPPLHIPLGPPASAGLRHRGERPRRCLRLPAALLCFQEEKNKSNGNSLV